MNGQSAVHKRKAKSVHRACGTLMDIYTQIPSCANLTNSLQSVIHPILVDLERLEFNQQQKFVFCFTCMLPVRDSTAVNRFFSDWGRYSPINESHVHIPNIYRLMPVVEHSQKFNPEPKVTVYGSLRVA